MHQQTYNSLLDLIFSLVSDLNVRQKENLIDELEELKDEIRFELEREE